MQYRKKPAVIEATQWFKNGDHPQDRSIQIDAAEGASSEKLTEGQVVRFFRSLTIPGGRFCSECGNVFQKHGMLHPDHALNADEKVCPGDYIVTNPKGQYYVLKPEDFERQFEPYEPVATPTPNQLVT